MSSSNRPTVFVEDTRKEYARLAAMFGDPVPDYDEADIIVFTGGQDISPSLYGETYLETTRTNPARDAYEVSLFQRMMYRNPNPKSPKAFVGICRGAQLCAVMSGAKLWQDVKDHTKDHPVLDYATRAKFKCSSTHHQQIRIPPGSTVRYEVLAVACDKDGAIVHNTKKFFPERMGSRPHDNRDIEAIWFPETRSLCFQPHPEYAGYPECTDLFLRYVKNYVYPALGIKNGENFIEWPNKPENK